MNNPSTPPITKIQRAGVHEIDCRISIRTITFTEDGKRILGGGQEGDIRRWRIRDGQEVGRTKTSKDINGVVVSKDGRWIVGATGNPHKAVVWDATTREEVAVVTEHGGGVDTIDISHDSTRFATGSYDHSVRIFSITSGVRLLGPLQHENWVVGVKFSPSGNKIATATRDRDSVRVYDAHTGQKLFDISIKVQAFPITPLAWSSGGQQLFVVSPGKMTSLDVSTSSVSQWPTHNTNPHTSVVSNGRFIACSAGSSVSFWDTLSHTQIGLVIEHTSDIECIALSADEKYLACCRKDRRIIIHDLGNDIPSLYFTMDPPLMRLSEAVFKSWMQGNLVNTEEMLSRELEGSSELSHYTLANRALIRTRLNRRNEAIEDAKRSLQVRPSPIGHIAHSLALAGQADQEAELSAFDLAFRDCTLKETRFLLLLKSILLFVSGKHESAMSRITNLIPAEDDNMTYYYTQVLGTMFTNKGEYGHALGVFENNMSKLTSTDERRSPLISVSLIFDWSFEHPEMTALQCLCLKLYSSGNTKEVIKTAWRVINTFAKSDKEDSYGCFLDKIVTCTSNVTLLAWNGASSTYHSCLPSPSPSTPISYNPKLRISASPNSEVPDIDARAEKTRTTLSQLDAVIIYDRITRLPPPRFLDRHLHLPCLVFPVKSLSIGNSESQGKEVVYCAKTIGLGGVKITTAQSLPLNEPERLVLIHPWIRDIRGPHDDNEEVEVDCDDAGLDTVESELVPASLVSVSPYASPDAYARALKLITRLGDPFTALLLLQQPGGVYKRAATEHEIIAKARFIIPKVVRAEVLEIL